MQIVPDRMKIFGRRVREMLVHPLNIDNPTMGLFLLLYISAVGCLWYLTYHKQTLASLDREKLFDFASVFAALWGTVWIGVGATIGSAEKKKLRGQISDPSGQLGPVSPGELASLLLAASEHCVQGIVLVVAVGIITLCKPFIIHSEKAFEKAPQDQCQASQPSHKEEADSKSK
jgi:hypothetical protein